MVELVFIDRVTANGTLDFNRVGPSYGEVDPTFNEKEILAIERPDSNLWIYYLLTGLAVFPILPIIILPMWFKYHTLRYRFTSEGVSMSWGILFRRETLLNYARIQDIHLRSNLIERWLGLARILIQTASGNASAEMTIEGIKEFEAIRDFLYFKMRGVRDAQRGGIASHPAAADLPESPAIQGELVATLREIAAEIRQLRTSVARPLSPSEAKQDV